jgi:hypothetical protein
MWRIPLDPRIAGSNPAESDGLLRAIKIRSTLSFGGEVKPSVPCRKILLLIKSPFIYDSDTDRQNSATISCPIILVSLLDVLAKIRAENSGG